MSERVDWREQRTLTVMTATIMPKILNCLLCLGYVCNVAPKEYAILASHALSGTDSSDHGPMVPTPRTTRHCRNSNTVTLSLRGFAPRENIFSVVQHDTIISAQELRQIQATLQDLTAKSKSETEKEGLFVGNSLCTLLLNAIGERKKHSRRLAECLFKTL